MFRFIKKHGVVLQWVVICAIFVLGQVRSEHASNEARHAVELTYIEDTHDEYEACLNQNSARKGIYALIRRLVIGSGGSDERADELVELAQEPEILPQIDCGPEPPRARPGDDG